MRLLPSGTTALLAELDDLAQVLALRAELEASPPAGVVDVVPAARTLLVTADPARTDLGRLAAALRSAARSAAARPAGSTGAQEAGTLEVPVVYDGADLADVAAALGADVEEVVRRHQAEDWTVAFCGFAPGFGYLVPRGGGWDVPRRERPRTRVPAGSVAVAGGFAGVYPRQAPGGWQLLGRTDLAVLDLDRDPAVLLRPGTRVRFVAVSG